MARLYTDQEIEAALHALRIQPIRGLVNTKEAASILSWRATAEHGVDHIYPEAAVRRHVEKGNLSRAKSTGKRNLFKVEAVFLVPLSPNRGLKQQHHTEETHN